MTDNTGKPGSRAAAGSAEATTNGHNGTAPPIEWWLAQQWADVTGSYAEEPMRDELGISGWQALRNAMADSLGVEITPEMSFADLRVVPADFAARHAETTLSRAQIAAYAKEHGLDMPDVIAARLARERSMEAEQARDKARALFDGDPLPLIVTKLPPFPVHALPEVMADMVTGVARELGIDPAMTAAFALGAVSGALAGRIVVQVYGNWFENCVSYIAVVAESGDRKSPAFSAMLGGPLGAVERQLTEACWVYTYEEVDPDGPDGLPVITLAGEPEFVGPAPRLIASDATPEQLAVLMADNGERMIVADAEGDVFDMLAGRYSAMPNMTLFLQGYSREYVRVDRVGRAPVALDHPALTLCLGTQPTVWHAVMANPRFAGKGFAARIEAAFPEPRKERTRRLAALAASERLDPVPVDPAVAGAYRTMITELALGMFDANTTTVKLTEDAQQRMRQHTAEVDRRTLDDGDMGGRLARWGAKCSGRVARRALHLHMAEHGVKGVPLLIERDTIERAIEIEEWFITNAKEAYGLANTGDDVNAEDLKAFVAWLARKHADAPYQPVMLTHISQHATPKALRQKSRRDRAIEVLVDLNYLAHVKVGTSGKASAVCLHPVAAED